MNSINLSDLDLINKYFSFLEKYGFKYISPNKFEDSRIRILIQFDKMTSISPTITLWIKSEPKFTSIDVTWLLNDYIDYERLRKSKSFESNVSYYANLLHENITRIINQNDMDKLLLKGLKRLFYNIIKFNNLSKYNLLNNLSGDARKYFYYIKSKDRKWDPTKDIFQ